jgi:dienelactone hydrolase
MLKTPAFEDIFDGFMDLYGQNHLDEALTLLKTQAQNYPEWDALTRMWEVSLLAHSGTHQEALDKLQQALDSGLWYHEDALVNDPDLQSLVELPAYKALVERSAEMRKAALRSASPQMEVNRPTNPEPWPLLVAFHGNNNSIAASRDAWIPAVQQGWEVALAQSSQPSWLSNHYNWNFPDALDQVGAQIGTLLAEEPVQTGKVAVGGFSMGASLALRLGLEGKQPIHAVIAVEPWMPDPVNWPGLIQDCPLPGPKFFLVGGKENGEYFTWLQWIDNLLRTAGFDSTLIEATNPIHRLPDEFDSILSQVLTSL